MRFHLIDRIDSWELEKNVTGRKVTSVAEEYWQDDSRGEMVMPSALMLESVCQAATWLFLLGSDFSKRAALLSVEEVIFSGDVGPGDVLNIEASIASLSGDAAVLDGTVHVGDIRVLTASGIMCALLDADTLEDLQDTQRMARELCQREDVR